MIKLFKLTKPAFAVGLALSAGAAVASANDNNCQIHNNFSFCGSTFNIGDVNISPPWIGNPKVMIENRSDQPASYSVLPYYEELSKWGVSNEFSYPSKIKGEFTIPAHGTLELPYVAKGLKPGREYFFVVVNETSSVMTYISLDGAIVETKPYGGMVYPPHP